MEFATSAEGSPAPPARGEAVALVGLQAAQHNGATGTVVDDLHATDGRIGVKICYGARSRTMRLKPKNLRRIEACATFDDRGVAPCPVLSPNLLGEIAATFRQKQPWTLPRAAETIVRAQLLRDDVVISEGCLSLADAEPPAWAADEKCVARRVKQAQDAGLEEMAALRDELDGAACAKGLRCTQSYEHHARLIHQGRPREALALLVGVGDITRRDSPASVCRCFRKEPPSDEETALLTGGLEHTPTFLASLAGLPRSFAVPLTFEPCVETFELRNEIRLTLAEEPGDARKIYLRLTHPAVPVVPPVETVKRARAVIETRLPRGSQIAPRFDSKTTYVTVADAERYHRIQCSLLTGRTRAGRGPREKRQPLRLDGVDAIEQTHASRLDATQATSSRWRWRWARAGAKRSTARPWPCAAAPTSRPAARPSRPKRRRCWRSSARRRATTSGSSWGRGWACGPWGRDRRATSSGSGRPLRRGTVRRRPPGTGPSSEDRGTREKGATPSGGSSATSGRGPTASSSAGRGNRGTSTWGPN